MLTKEQKGQIITDLKDKFARQKTAFFVSFTGVNVKTAQEFRRSLKGVQGEYKVAKKTFLSRALDEQGVKDAAQGLEGQVGIVFDYASETNAAKIIYDFTKKSSLHILGGLMNANILSKAQVVELASLPDLDSMRARLAGILNAPLTYLARSLKGVQINLVNVLKAVGERKPS